MAYLLVGCRPSVDLAITHTKRLGIQLMHLGFALNLAPTQPIVYLGIQLDTATMLARILDPRREALHSALMRFHLMPIITVFSVMSLLGIMSSAHAVVPLGLLHMCRLGGSHSCVYPCASSSPAVGHSQQPLSGSGPLERPFSEHTDTWCPDGKSLLSHSSLYRCFTQYRVRGPVPHLGLMPANGMFLHNGVRRRMSTQLPGENYYLVLTVPVK